MTTIKKKPPVSQRPDVRQSKNTPQPILLAKQSTPSSAPRDHFVAAAAPAENAAPTAPASEPKRPDRETLIRLTHQLENVVDTSHDVEELKKASELTAELVPFSQGGGDLQKFSDLEKRINDFSQRVTARSAKIKQILGLNAELKGLENDKKNPQKKAAAEKRSRAAVKEALTLLKEILKDTDLSPKQRENLEAVLHDYETLEAMDRYLDGLKTQIKTLEEIKPRSHGLDQLLRILIKIEKEQRKPTEAEMKNLRLLEKYLQGDDKTTPKK